ncbi:MAG: type I glyceraldehyde-3-phosphate dehydrogenase [Thermoplasmatota archaeon]
MDGEGPRIAINGFGRIGRLLTRILLAGDEPVDLVGINDPTAKATLAHLFRYDSVHGRFSGHVEETEDGLVLNGDRLRMFHEREPGGLWEDLQPDLVVEASGHFGDRAGLQAHLDAGAPRLLVTAPAPADLMVVRGVNDHLYDPDIHHIVSNASCTTNCLAPVLKTLDDAFGVESAMMTTVHAATNDQRVADAPHADLRRARGTLGSMIPTTTGAARAIGTILPHLDGRVDGQAIRVPTEDVSLVDLVAQLEAAPTQEDVLSAFQAAEAGPLQGILSVEQAPLVSVDFLGNTHSAIVDAPALQVLGNTVKVLAWYDNEWGYATRVAEMVHKMA